MPRVSKLRHAADGRGVVRNERRRQSESGLLRVLLSGRGFRAVVYDGRDDRTLRRHADASERGFGNEHHARRVRRLHAGGFPETEALETVSRAVTGRPAYRTGRTQAYLRGGRFEKGFGCCGSDREEIGRIFSVCVCGRKIVCRKSDRLSGSRGGRVRRLAVASSVMAGGRVCGRRAAWLGKARKRTAKTKRTSVKDRGPLRFGYVSVCRVRSELSSGRVSERPPVVAFPKFCPERRSVISPETSSRDDCSVSRRRICRIRRERRRRRT